MIVQQIVPIIPYINKNLLVEIYFESVNHFILQFEYDLINKIIK